MARCEQKLLNLTLLLAEFVYSLTILLISLITISYCFNVITRSRYFFLDVWKWEESMFVQQWLAPSSLFRIGIFSPHKQYPSIILLCMYVFLNFHYSCLLSRDTTFTLHDLLNWHDKYLVRGETKKRGRKIYFFQGFIPCRVDEWKFHVHAVHARDVKQILEIG